ncbi:adenylosuccinate lyase [Anaerobacillus sp. MEB173]|uniref:adenylosuccinate lyase n=1 Tax=Anaerobacillus sp. MEB173 TaxID=3383345 RepID=UPI003F92EA6B
MGNHMLSSDLFCDQFSTEEMRKVFSDENMVQKWIDVEVALALAEAECGVIPVEAAKEIANKGKAELFNFSNIKEGIDHTWHPIVPFIREFKTLCIDDMGEYIHWGVTTQDVMDTGVVLQIKEGLQIVEKDLKRLENILCYLAEKYKDTVMAGRTHGQHALPITFGYKVAVWASEVNRHLERLEKLKPRVLTGNVSGAVGTLASLGDIGLEVQKTLMQKLDLNVPEIAWHVSRDRLADVTTFLGMVGATFGKIANEIIQLQKTEIAELAEPFQLGKVGSSTMPQKRNPMACEAVMAISQLLRHKSSLGIESMFQEHERDMGPWQAEWAFIPEMFQLSSGLLYHMSWILEKLHVNPDAMLENLNKSKQLIMSEAVMMHTAKTIGRQEAHDLVYEIAMEAYEKDTTLSEILKANPRIKGIMSDEEIDEMLNPINYVGLSQKFTNQVIMKINKGNKVTT